MRAVALASSILFAGIAAICFSHWFSAGIRLESERRKPDATQASVMLFMAMQRAEEDARRDLWSAITVSAVFFVGACAAPRRSPKVSASPAGAGQPQPPGTARFTPVVWGPDPTAIPPTPPPRR